MLVWWDITYLLGKKHRVKHKDFYLYNYKFYLYIYIFFPKCFKISRCCVIKYAPCSYSLPPYTLLYSSGPVDISTTPLPAGFLLVETTRGRLGGGGYRVEFSVYNSCQHLKTTEDNDSFSLLPLLTHWAPAFLPPQKYLCQLILHPGWSEHQLQGITLSLLVPFVRSPFLHYILVTPKLLFHSPALM